MLEGKMMNGNLIGLIDPKPGSTVLICDVHASESGALAILTDLYHQICAYEDKSVTWVMAVSIPRYPSEGNVIVERYPWAKRNWAYRYYFDTVIVRRILKKHHPDQVVSLQNSGLPFYAGRQIVYLHQALFLTRHRMDVRKDGLKLWLYQNVISKMAFRSLKKADVTVVQTRWMQEALANQAGIPPERIILQQPDISGNGIGQYRDTPENRKRFFYPATGMAYKNHMTLLRALQYARDKGLQDYELVLTIRPTENAYTKMLYAYAGQWGLNVIFGGQISREQVFELYTRSTLVFPSCVESFGLPLLEARMTGSPVIASDTPFCREILAGYEKACFFRELDHVSLGEWLLKTVNNELEDGGYEPICRIARCGDCPDPVARPGDPGTVLKTVCPGGGCGNE